MSRDAIPYDNRINFGISAARTEYCTGADLEVIARRSYQDARRKERDTVIEEDIVSAASDFISAYDPATYEYVTLLALRDANFATLVPPSLDPAIMKQVYADKKLNRAKVNQRIAELEKQMNQRQIEGL